jgi:hypothetical protein
MGTVRGRRLHLEIDFVSVLEAEPQIEGNALVVWETFRDLRVEDFDGFDRRFEVKNRLNHVAQEFRIGEKKQLEDDIQCGIEVFDGHGFPLNRKAIGRCLSELRRK